MVGHTRASTAAEAATNPSEGSLTDRIDNKSDENGNEDKKVHNDHNDTCAWTPNKVFIHFLLVSVETARVLLQSWWARLSTGASREAPVDNECLGKSRQVGDDGKF